MIERDDNTEGSGNCRREEIEREAASHEAVEGKTAFFGSSDRLRNKYGHRHLFPTVCNCQGQPPAAYKPCLRNRLVSNAVETTWKKMGNKPDGQTDSAKASTKDRGYEPKRTRERDAPTTARTRENEVRQTQTRRGCRKTSSERSKNVSQSVVRPWTEAIPLRTVRYIQPLQNTARRPLLALRCLSHHLHNCRRGYCWHTHFLDC